MNAIKRDGRVPQHRADHHLARRRRRRPAVQQSRRLHPKSTRLIPRQNLERRDPSGLPIGPHRHHLQLPIRPTHDGHLAASIRLPFVRPQELQSRDVAPSRSIVPTLEPPPHSLPPPPPLSFTEHQVWARADANDRLGRAPHGLVCVENRQITHRLAAPVCAPRRPRPPRRVGSATRTAPPPWSGRNMYRDLGRQWTGDEAAALPVAGYQRLLLCPCAPVGGLGGPLRP